MTFNIKFRQNYKKDYFSLSKAIFYPFNVIFQLNKVVLRIKTIFNPLNYFIEPNSKKDLDVTETEVRGTEVRLRNLQLRDSASTLVFLQIKIIIQCTRCHNRLDVKTPPNQVNAVPCQKCNQSQLVNFRPSMAHQYSSVIGYLDVEGCTAFDLVMQDCQFKLGCMRCSKETTVQVNIFINHGLLTRSICHIWTCSEYIDKGKIWDSI